MKLESVYKSYFIEYPEADYQDAEEIGCFRFGAEAVYIPGFPAVRYLPLAALRRAWVQESSLSVGGSRSAGMSLYVLRAQREDGLWQNFAFNREEDARRALERMRKLNPKLPGAPEIL